MTTLDSVSTVYYYYQKLAKEKHWGLGSRLLTPGGVSAVLNIKEAKFTADIGLDIVSDKTSIEIMITTGTFEPSDDYDYDVAGATSTDNTTSTASGEYIIADSNTREISESELISLTPWQLKVARNEIYARHGREFVHKDLQCYFVKQSWYKIDPSFSESDLGSIENKNVATILSYETKTGSPLLRTDNGCK